MAIARPKQPATKAHTKFNHEATDAVGSSIGSSLLCGARIKQEYRQ
jgi:hypothetical protein